jgi:hypothetical protein
MKRSKVFAPGVGSGGRLQHVAVSRQSIHLDAAQRRISDPVLRHTEPRERLHLPASVGGGGRRRQHLDTEVGHVPDGTVEIDEVRPLGPEQHDIGLQHVVLGEDDVDR